MARAIPQAWRRVRATQIPHILFLDMHLAERTRHVEREVEKLWTPTPGKGCRVACGWFCREVGKGPEKRRTPAPGIRDEGASW